DVLGGIFYPNLGTVTTTVITPRSATATEAQLASAGIAPGLASGMIDVFETSHSVVNQVLDSDGGHLLLVEPTSATSGDVETQAQPDGSTMTPSYTGVTGVGPGTWSTVRSTYDAYGNVTGATTSISATQFGAVTLTREVTTAFDNHIDRWQLGLPTRTEVIS